MGQHKTLLYTNDGYGDYSGETVLAITLDGTNFGGISTNYCAGLEILITNVNNDYPDYGGSIRCVGHVLRHGSSDCEVSVDSTQEQSQPPTDGAAPDSVTIATGTPGTDIEISFTPAYFQTTWRIFVIARVITDDQA